MPDSPPPATTTPTPHDLFNSIPWHAPTPTVPAWHKRGIPYLPTSNILQTLDIWLPTSSSGAESISTADLVPQADSIPNPPTDLTTRQGYWLILIHGGGWRDPVVTSLNFAEPAVGHLLSALNLPPSPTTSPSPPSTVPPTTASDASPQPDPSSPPHQPKIAGILSLSYTLSSNKLRCAPASSFSTPAEAAEAASRSALHPQHILDVLAGLRFACAIFGPGVERNGVLVGHSCGATLALQCVMASGETWMREAVEGRAQREDREDRELEEEGEGIRRPFTPPALLLLCGLYDLPLLAEPTSSEFVQYRQYLRDMVAEAFGPEKSEAEKSEAESGTAAGSIWRHASPALALLDTKEAAGFEAKLPEATQLICLAVSETDGLVPPEQGREIVETLRVLQWEEHEGRDGKGEGGENKGKRLMQLEVAGQHDVIWEEGGEMARAVWATLAAVEGTRS